MLFMYVGIFYMTNDKQDFIKNETSPFHYIMFPLIFLPTMIFFFNWVKVICLNFLMMIYIKNVKAFRLVTLNLWDSNKFYRSYFNEDMRTEIS